MKYLLVICLILSFGFAEGCLDCKHEIEERVQLVISRLANIEKHDQSHLETAFLIGELGGLERALLIFEENGCCLEDCP